MNRRPILLALLSLSCAASAGDGQTAWNTPVADPDPCPQHPPPGWVLEIANASGSQAEAIDAAREAARAVLIRETCAGYTDLQCAAVRRHIRPWGAGRWVEERRSQGTACAAVAIERKYLDLILEEYAAFDRDLEALATKVRIAVGGADPNAGWPVTLEPTTWAGDCVAGQLGAAIGQRFRGELAGLRFTRSGVEDPTAAHLRLTLSPGAGGVHLGAALQAPGSSLEIEMGGLDFSLDLFGVDANERGDCPSSSRYAPTLSSGLRVSIQLPVPDGQICEGQSAPLAITSNRPAHLYLFSVTPRDGAWLIWPVPGTDGRVDGTRDLGSYQTVRPVSGGDERLVLVGVDATSHWPEAAGWQGPCTISGGALGFAPPAMSAVATTTYAVLAPGQGGCTTGVGGYDPAALEASLAAFPVCGR